MYDPDAVYFEDRQDAGRRLAARLEDYRGKDAVVLALPRGGVVVGYEIARHLSRRLDVIITRKIGAPGNPEYAIGAVAENGEVVVNQPEIQMLGISRLYLEAEIAHQKEEIERRIQLYRGGQRLPPLKGKTAILVDDGIATGYTMLAAAKAARAEAPAEVVVAVPVAAPGSLTALKPLVSSLVYLAAPSPFWAVGVFYRNFEQISDQEVKRLLDEARRAEGSEGEQPGAG